MEIRILFERNIAKKYIKGLERQSWTTIEHCDNYFDPTAKDTEIADFAYKNNWVVFTTDTDFFEVKPECGVLFINQNSDPDTGDIIKAVKEIAKQYSNYNDIKESIPGRWI